MAWETAATDNFAFGSGTAYNSNNIELYSKDSQFEVHYSGNAFIGSYKTNEFFTFDQDKNNIIITNQDGTSNSTYSFASKTFTCGYNLYIFALHRANTLLCSYAQKCKNFIIYDNGICIRNLQACYDTIESSIGLYDILNKKFYAIQGTGTNSYGNKINNIINI